MNPFRELSSQEKTLLVTLLQATPDTLRFINSVDDLVAKQMNDGGMGSLLLVPKGLEGASRSFGRQLVLGEFTDSDGVPVSVALNVDSEGRLYELDVWKVNFTPLVAWPNPSAIRIMG